MPIDPFTLKTAIELGMAIVANTAVQEATKSAFTALKDKVASLLKLGSDSDASSAKAELVQALGNLTEAEQAELTPLLKAFVAALSDDPSVRDRDDARKLIDLDLDAAGDIRLSNITGPDGLAMKAKSGGNIDISDITFSGSVPPGN